MAKPNKPDDDKPETLKVDILGMELATGAPHWLHPVHSRPPKERQQEIRDKHRAKAKARKT